MVVCRPLLSVMKAIMFGWCTVRLRVGFKLMSPFYFPELFFSVESKTWRTTMTTFVTRMAMTTAMTGRMLMMMVMKITGNTHDDGCVDDVDGNDGRL